MAEKIIAADSQRMAEVDRRHKILLMRLVAAWFTVWVVAIHYWAIGG